ncbi:unnamed protein product [Spirodela intermedia]|uniref:RRM domain-containing protein n=1 Tax=Spirodela intermedia TaxID=51605 RepID=A0A7I8J903_SPIIN|nr:unnamed protein product [Spirodela intermedia]CAA6666667.1 unnamed protein product [Spirodela intermedia]
MRRYFDQFGEIQEAVVIRDKTTGRSKGYGFVTFKDAESAQRACQDPSPVIDGRRANCNLASLGASTHSRSRPPTPSPSTTYHAPSTPTAATFYHQPTHYPLPFSVCGYYGVCGGGHNQFSPYYGAGAAELGVFHNFYPYYPQMLQYPYLPRVLVAESSPRRRPWLPLQVRTLPPLPHSCCIPESLRRSRHRADR